VINNDTPSRLEIIWREWRHSEDEEYAQRLFDLVRDTPVGWKGVLLLALCGTLYGLMAGYFVGLVLLNWPVYSAWSLTGPLPLALSWMAGVAGGLSGVLISQSLSWQRWLALLTPNIFSNKMGKLSRLNVALLCGFLAGLIGLPDFLGVAASVLIGVTLDINRETSFRFGMNLRRKIFVMGLVSLLGLFIASVIVQGTWLSVGVGLVVGSWLGISLGSLPLGLILCWLGILAGSIIVGLDAWLFGWLGMGTGFGLGLVPVMVGPGINVDDAYNHRAWYVWWKNQPLITKVIEALRPAADTDFEARVEWQSMFKRLDQRKIQTQQVDQHLAALQSSDWANRFLARQALIELGGIETEALKKLAAQDSERWQETAIWLLTGIEQETTHRFARRTHEILCPACLTRFGRHQVDLTWGIYFTYYGCRVCGQSREFLEGVTQVVAVLDTEWTPSQAQQDHQLRVNWLERRALFDFDRVEIIRATDEDVERFAVQVGNDTDRLRKTRYRQIRCLIRHDCRLSENTLRILGSLFNQADR
jgi:hypothetical protein